MLGRCTRMTTSVTDFRAPWEVYPQIPWGSIHWRMGPGEDVMNDWWKAIRALTHEQRLAYRQRHTGSAECNKWLDWVIEQLQKEQR